MREISRLGGTAYDDLGGKDDFRIRNGMPFDLVDEQVAALVTQLIGGLADRGDGGNRHGGKVHIVESHDGNLGRDVQMKRVRGLYHGAGIHIGSAENGVWLLVSQQQGSGHRKGQVKVDVLQMSDPFLPHGKACCGERAFKSFFPQDGITVVERRIDECDLLFPDGNKVIDGILGGCIVVYGYKGDIFFAVILGTHDNRVFHADAVQRFAGWDAVAEDDALKQLAPEESLIGRGIACVFYLLQEQLIASALGGGLHSHNTFAVKRIDKIGKTCQHNFIIA